MAWFGGKKKPKRKPPVLEPVGTPSVQAAPAAVQAAPVAQPVQPNQGIPAVQAAPAAQPIVEVAPVGAIADSNVMVSTEPVATPPASPEPVSTGWSKKSEKPLLDIHKKLDHMMDAKGKSLEERYKDRFGDKLPESVATDSARKEYNENKESKPEIVFKPRSKLKLKPKGKVTPKTKVKAEEKSETKTEEKEETNEDNASIAGRLTDGLKIGGGKTRKVLGSATSAVGRGAGAVKSGIGRGAGAVGSGIGRGAGVVKSGIGMGASKVMGLFSKGSKKSDSKTKGKNYGSMKVAELKAELKKKGLSISGKKADLVKRLTK